MSRAWTLAREGQRIYGGTVRQYLAEALRITWAELKADPTERAVAALMSDMRAARGKAPAIASPYLARYARHQSRGRIWAGARL